MNFISRLSSYNKRRLFKYVSLIFIFVLCLFNISDTINSFYYSHIIDNQVKNKLYSKWDDIIDNTPNDNKDTTYNSNEFYEQPFCYQYLTTYSTEDNKDYRKTTSIRLPSLDFGQYEGVRIQGSSISFAFTSEIDNVKTFAIVQDGNITACFPYLDRDEDLSSILKDFKKWIQ